MTLKNSVVIFLASDTYAASLTSAASEISMASTNSKTLFSSKQFLILMVSSPVVPKWLILVPFCGLNHSKFKSLLIFGNIYVRGCWGQLILFFEKKNKTQISKPPDYAATGKWRNMLCVSKLTRITLHERMFENNNLDHGIYNTHVQVLVK